MATPGQSFMAGSLPRAFTSSSGNVPPPGPGRHLLAMTVRTLWGSFVCSGTQAFWRVLGHHTARRGGALSAGRVHYA